MDKLLYDCETIRFLPDGHGVYRASKALRDYLSSVYSREAKCDRCSKTIEVLHDDFALAKFTGDNFHYLCNEHKDEYGYRTCDFCRRFYLVSKMHIVQTFDVHGATSSNMICGGCDTALVYCRDCNRAMRQSSALWNNGTRGRCSECTALARENEEITVSSVSRPYGMGENCTTNGKKLLATRYIGVEIEAKVSRRKLREVAAKLPSCIGIKRDGSLADTKLTAGVEFITPPRKGRNAEELIKTVTGVLLDSGAKVYKTCGMHVHIDGVGFIPKRGGKITKLARLWNLYSAASGTIQTFLPTSRRTSRFCKNIERMEVSTNGRESLTSFQLKLYGHLDSEGCVALSSTERRRIIRDEIGVHYNGARYYEMNLHALFTLGTIEFRSHSGTLNDKKIIEWANLHLRLVDLAYKGGARYKAALVFPKDKARARKHLYKVLGLERSSRTYFGERAEKFGREDDPSSTTLESSYQPEVIKGDKCAV